MVKFDTTEATFYEDGNQIEYFVGETIADRRFENMTFEQAKNFCEEKGIDLYVQLEDGDTIEAEEYETAETKDIFFTIISNLSEETVNGLVHYHYDGGKTIKWQNPLFGWYDTIEFPFTNGELHDAVISHNLHNEMTLWTDNVEQNEFLLYSFRDFDIVLNPQDVDEAFLNTMVCWGADVKTKMPKLTRQSIGDLLVRIRAMDTGNLYRTAPNQIHVTGENAYSDCEVHVIVECDAEMMDAIEKTILRMAFITKGDD